MEILTKEQRKQLSTTCLEARDVAKKAAVKTLHTLGVDKPDPPQYLSADERTIRRALRAQARQLGDKEDPRKKGSFDLYHLTEKIAYDQWHRMLFARFLAENELLISLDHGVAVSLAECRELAPEIGLKDEWDVAVRFAARSLPEIFRPDDPAGKIELAPEDRASLRDLVVGLTRETFLADDSLGWSYQFWQTKRKKEVDAAGNKIGADELPAVTQLFTEDYMVDFLLDNTLGAWWAGKKLTAEKATNKELRTEEDIRRFCSLPGVPWTYLRFIQDADAKWTPAAGTFDGWPQTAKELKCLDPCMGSGHFVVAMFDRLVALRMAEDNLDEQVAVKAVIAENLYGLEIDPRCTQIAAFNLALAAWRRIGHCALPAMNLACSGLAPNAKKEEWLKLAGSNNRLQNGMERLYGLFKDASILGSLINPRAGERDLFVAAFHELQPLLEKALAEEAEDDVHEMAVTARGLAKAAEILAGQFTLVATNVPFLGRGKQNLELKQFSEAFHPLAKNELSTTFVERCIQLCRPSSVAALVSPQSWLFLTTYAKLRADLLRRASWNLVVRLGPAAFEDMNWWAATTQMLVISNQVPAADAQMAGTDVSEPRDPEEKARQLLRSPLQVVLQVTQLNNPDARISLGEKTKSALLQNFADAYQGIGTSDNSQFLLCFWEIPNVSSDWRYVQCAPERPDFIGGCSHILPWENGAGRYYRHALALKAEGRLGGWKSGGEAWNKCGLTVKVTGNRYVNLYMGDMYDTTVATVIPKDLTHLPAIYTYIISEDYDQEIESIDQAVSITEHTLLKVPFDLAHWQKVAALQFPDGLPKPVSGDPIQWLFNGHPKDSDQPLQVAVARLLGYRWPRQTGSSFPDCSALCPDGLEKLADDDGIVCINPIKGEQPAAERLRVLFAKAFGMEWTPGKQNELLEQAGFGGKTLEDWLRNGFFEQHCQLFHQRPFIWQIWDGRRDGFSALVNYHKLNRRNLEKLTYAFLGDWIFRQKAANEAGEEGSDARLQAAHELKSKLEKIIEGQAPYDIFVRWKSLEQQPIGWEPDLNDGVRLNIRPFVEARVLRKDPKINWKKDRGKDVASVPWYKVFKGERINDHHLELEEKRKARSKN